MRAGSIFDDARMRGWHMSKQHSVEASGKPRTHLPILCLLAGMTILSLFPLDVLLPAYSSMARHFSKTPADIAASISVFTGFFAVSQLVVGPLSDALGRRTLLLLGFTLVVLSTLGCAQAPTYETFLVCRALQAVGCSTFVLSQALIQDFFQEADRHRLRIYLVSFSGVLISLSPLIGTLLEAYYDWPASFYLSAALAFSLILLVIFCYPAENRGRREGFGAAFNSYRFIVKEKKFLLYWALSGFAFACHFSFIIVSPLIFVGDFNLDNYTYSLILLAYGLAYIGGGLLARYMATRLSVARQIAFGLALILFAGLALLGSVIAEVRSIATVLMPMIICTAGTTLVRPAATSQAMRLFADNAGAAGAAGATLVFLTGALSSALVSQWDSNLYAALALLFITLSGAGLMLNPWGDTARQA
jgi:DHA1 family 2-module integral membrane pump EmrD-like MFS transporter